MCNEQERIAFCIWRLIDSHLSPTSSLIFFSTSFEQPPRTSMMMLYWLTLYSGYRFVSSSLSWLYFVVFSKSLDSLFSSHGQLISITLTCLLVLSMTVASILLAFTWVVSVNNGTSQKVVACSFSYSGLGVTCENRGSTLVMRSKDLRTSKNRSWKHCHVSVGTKGAFHLSELTGQTIPNAMRVSILMKSLQPDQSSPK